MIEDAYHPAANGMVEHFHRQLKTALCAVEDPGNWSDNLPLALLGIRAALKSDLGCSAAELVFSTTLRLPGEMVTPTSRGADETPDNLVHRLRQFMRSLSSVAPRNPMTKSYVEQDLDNCTHVFVRCDRVRQPLEVPYEGPFHMLARIAKTCRILRGDKEDVVSVDRVKSAFAEEPPDLSQGQKCADPLTPDNLGTANEEILDPFEKFAADAHDSQLVQETLVRNTVERFPEINAIIHKIFRDRDKSPEQFFASNANDKDAIQVESSEDNQEFEKGQDTAVIETVAFCVEVIRVLSQME
ncbi:hypothetical protein SprV_0100370600 [Sparganum proliferum]